MARSKRTTRVVNYTESPVSSPGNAPPSAAATTNNNNQVKKKKKQQTLQQWTGGAVKSTETTENNNNDVVAGGQLKRHSNGKFVHTTSSLVYHFLLHVLYVHDTYTLSFDDMSLHSCHCLLKPIHHLTP